MIQAEFCLKGRTQILLSRTEQGWRFMYTSQPCPHPRGGSLGGSPSLHLREVSGLCPLFASGDNGTLASLIFRRAAAVRCASTGRSVRVSGCSAGLRQLSPQMPPKVRAQRPTQNCGYCQKEGVG